MAEVFGKFDSERGRYCCIQGSGGGRAQVWGPKGGAPQLQITPEAHLAAPLTCFVWLSLDLQPSSDRKARKRKCSENGLGQEGSRSSTHIAFGTSSGKVLVYSLARDTMETYMEDRSSSGDRQITTLDWNEVHGLHTCSTDDTVREWSITENCVKSKCNLNKIGNCNQTSSTTAIKLVYNSHSDRFSTNRLLLTASFQIKLWCLNSKRLLRTMVGHSSNVRLLDVLPITENDKLYAISGSKNDRILSLWSMNITDEELSNSTDTDSSKQSEDIGKQKKKKNSRRSMTDSETVVNANCNFLMEDIARQFSFVTGAKNQNAVKLCALTRSGVVHYYEHTLNGLLSKPLKPIMSLQVVTEEKEIVTPSPILCCVINNDSTIKIGYNLGTGMVFEQVVPNTLEKLHVLTRSIGEQDTTKKGNAMQITERATKIKMNDDKDKSVVVLSSAISRGEQNNLKRPIGGREGDVPMESRLANLSLAQTENKQTADTNNLAQLLVQALHSKDKKLLQSVFEHKDPDLAYSSLSRLPIQYISPLLDHLIEMLGRKTNQCKSACVWADALCKAKSSSLLALGSSNSSKLQELRTALAARLPSLPNLLSLRSRFALVLHRCSDAINTPAVQCPVLDYKDSSSEDEMVDDMDEIVLNNADDDSASWNEEDDNDVDDEDDDDDGNADNSPKHSDQNMSDEENEDENGMESD